MVAELLPTKAKTAEERRLELSDGKYVKKYRPVLTEVNEYDKYPNIKPFNLGDGKPRPIRFFSDGLEAVVGSGKLYTNTKLVLEEKKQVIDFYYETGNKKED